MTFPVVSTANYSEEAVDTFTHDVAVPSGINSGDLLMLFSGINGNTVTQPTVTGWTNLFFQNGAGTMTIGIWYKFASGSETAFTYTSSVAEQSSNRTWRVTAAHASSPPETVAGGTNGFSATCGGYTGSNPMIPSWGAADTMFVNFGVFNTNPTIAAYPANYDDNRFTDTTGGTDVTAAGLVTASRNINTASEAMPTFTLSSAVTQMGKSVAIRPAAAGGGAVSVDPMGMMGFFGS